MENNETWRERLLDGVVRHTIGGCAVAVGDKCDCEPGKRAVLFVESLLLTLADKIGAEKKNPTEDQEHGLEYDEGFDSALDTAISVIKEMVK